MGDYNAKRYGFMGRSVGGSWCGPESDALHRWLTMDDVKTANVDAGQYFFSPDTRRFFNSRIGQTLYQGPGGYYFVTSEQFEGSDGRRAARKFTVRKFDLDTGGVDTMGAFNELTRRQAHRAAVEYAAGHAVRFYKDKDKGASAHDDTSGS